MRTVLATSWEPRASGSPKRRPHIPLTGNRGLPESSRRPCARHGVREALLKLVRAIKSGAAEQRRAVQGDPIEISSRPAKLEPSTEQASVRRAAGAHQA